MGVGAFTAGPSAAQTLGFDHRGKNENSLSPSVLLFLLPRVAFPAGSAETSAMNPHDDLPTATICLLHCASTSYERRLGCRPGARIKQHVGAETWEEFAARAI